MCEAYDQDAYNKDVVMNKITLDPVLPAYGAPGVADEIFNARALVPMQGIGFTADHVVRSTLRSPHGDIVP